MSRRASSARRSAATRRPAPPGSCRPAGDASTRWSSACVWRRLPATSTSAVRPAPPPGRTCASWSSARRARSASSRPSRCGCGRFLRCVATRAGASRIWRRASRSCARSRSAGPSPTWRGSRTRPRPRWGSRRVGRGYRNRRGRRLPAARRLGGRRGRRGPSRRGRDRDPARRGCHAAGRGGRGVLAPRALPRAAPARRAAGRRHADRDAGDRDDLARSGGAARARRRDAAQRAGRREPDRRLPRLAPLRRRRVAVLHGARAP